MKLSAKVCDKFGPQPLFVMGNASARVDTPRRPPTLGIGLRLTLKRLGFKIAIVDEFQTPKCCPSCHSELHISTIRSDRCAISGGRNSISNDRGAKSQNKDEIIKSAEGRWPLHTFLSRPSPRPWLRHQSIRVHGLLRCTSRRCCDGLNGRSRYYDRDAVAVPNFRNIWNGYLNGDGRREYLCRHNAGEEDDDGGLGEDDDAAFKRAETPSALSILTRRSSATESDASNVFDNRDDCHNIANDAGKGNDCGMPFNV
jgi:hypothetical protein